MEKTNQLYDVYFGGAPNSIGTVVGTGLTEDEASKAMTAYQRKYFPNLGLYWRMWGNPGEVMHYDFGSHTKFFFRVPAGYSLKQSL